MQLRPIGPDDAEGYAALVRRVFGGLSLDPPPSAGRLTAEEVRAHLAEGGGATFGAEIAGLLWTPKDGGLYVSRVAVDPAWRGQGLASRLIDAAVEEARRRELPRIWLATRLALTSNRRLFARLGFVETVQHAHPGFATPTFVDMERWLSGELPAAACAVPRGGVDAR